MNDFESLYPKLKSSLQSLAGPLFNFAETMVKKQGTFLPFGATLNGQGEIAMQAASTGTDIASSIEILPIVHEGLRAAVAKDKVVAVAVCEWVKITPENQAQTDAVKVLVEHREGLTVAFYLPCRKPFLRSWQFGAMMALPAKPEVRAWNTTDAS